MEAAEQHIACLVSVHDRQDVLCMAPIGVKLASIGTIVGSAPTPGG